MYRLKNFYLCLEEWYDGEIHVTYCSYKPSKGKGQQCKWYKGYDTSVGFDAYKDLSNRIKNCKGHVGIERAKEIAKDVVKRYVERKN